MISGKKIAIEATIHKALAEAGVSHNEVPTDEFREASVKFNKTLSKDIRLEQGIFFTPKKARDILFTKLAEFGVTPKSVLEPSFGSGEFLLDAKRIYTDAKIIGVEKNEQLFKSVQCPGADLVCCDFLTWKGTVDLIIGNPPYFVMKTNTLTPKEKKDFAIKNATAMTGRPNIYILFLYKCLTEHLDPDGYLAFIIPTSLYNCSYYQPMRDYIHTYTTIKYVETLNKPGFYETGQETTLIILQKKKSNDDYIFKSKNGNVYISPYFKELYALTKDTQLLTDLGLGVKTGNIVWNQIKGNLADKGTLFYARNISNSELKIGNLCGKEQKQYVTDIPKPKLTGPHILVERGYGNSFRLNAVLVDLKEEFYAENHLNVVYPKTPDAVKNLAKVIKSFQDERSQQFVKWFCWKRIYVCNRS